MDAKHVWVGVGFVGQALFFGRFFVQWLASERAKRSVIPEAFWYFSIGGSLVLLSYAIWRRDPVFILGQSVPLAIYMRNLWFIHKGKRPPGASGDPVADTAT
ncbi:MAG TPA: lipid-A-disaccharide synthase N-terminal domain-containing protein [Thermoanaerobaculia bacterium]|jgi:lipid-A-disaccharide synthase-like uncharacterized protein|nr:lipid-A-disaccharide synthase N-terminal domain-containing protein [Thermoanaerobaculia bacterium]